RGLHALRRAVGHTAHPSAEHTRRARVGDPRRDARRASDAGARRAGRVAPRRDVARRLGTLVFWRLLGGGHPQGRMMKRYVGLAVATVLLASSAAAGAQTYACPPT